MVRLFLTSKSITNQKKKYKTGKCDKSVHKLVKIRIRNLRARLLDLMSKIIKYLNLHILSCGINLFKLYFENTR